MMVEGAGDTATIRSCFAKESCAITTLATMILNDMLGNASIKPETVTHA